MADRVVQLERDAGRVQLMGVGEERRDTDAAGDQQVPLRGRHRREQVAGRLDLEPVADGDVVVQRP